MPELRNLVYEAFFASYKQENATSDCTCHCRILRTSLYPARNMRQCINVFEVSEQMRLETRGMFFENFFTCQRYRLHSLPALQSFLRLPSSWISQQRELVLQSKDVNVAVQHAMVLRHALTTSAEPFQRLGDATLYILTQKVGDTRLRGHDMFRNQEWNILRHNIQVAYPVIFSGDSDFQRPANHDFAQSRPDGSFGTKDDPTWQGFKAELSLLVFRALVSPAGIEMCGVGTYSTLHHGSQWATVKFELTVEGRSGFSIGPWNLASLDWSSIPHDRGLLVDEVDAPETWVDDVTFKRMMDGFTFGDIPVDDSPMRFLTTRGRS